MAIISSYTIDPSDPVAEKTQSAGSLVRLVFSVVRPYRKWLLIIFAAMLLETAMNLAAPWPLKIIIDNVISHRPLDKWVSWIKLFSSENSKLSLVVVAAISVVIIAATG